MLFFSLAAVVIEGIIFILDRILNVFHSTNTTAGIIHDGALLIPIVLLALTYGLYVKDSESKSIPFFMMLTLTFSSIATIFAGRGMLEYHFSIFMVVAIIAYYEDIKLILVSTVIFAIFHVLGYFIFPEMAFGAQSYSLLMVSLHALFLVLTSTATILQILNKKKYTALLEEDRAKKEHLIKNVINQLADNSEQIVLTADSLIDNTEKDKNASTLIIETISEVAAGAKTQVEGAEETSKAMEEMAKGIQNIAHTASTISKDSMDMSKQSEEGYKLLKNAANQMDSIIKTQEHSAAVITKLSEHSDEINKIIEVISNISSQTNLLALNAAIEAQRAGEHGRGFAVVAEEVRRLAEQSSQSASQISALINEIRENTSEAVKSINSETKEVRIGKQVVDEAGNSFAAILNATDKVVSQIHELTALSEEMSAESEEITAYVEQMEEISRGFSNNFEKMTTAANEQSVIVEGNIKLADDLTQLSKKLEILILELKI
jgi:methyl-accepting chemotaxis protein